MSIFKTLTARIQVAKTPMRIVFPEGDDLRILAAVAKLAQEKLIQPIVLGNPKAVTTLATTNQLDLTGVKLLDSEHFDQTEAMFAQYVAASKKPLSPAEMQANMRQANYFGTLLVKMGLADGMVSGASHTTASTVLPALKLIHPAAGMHRVSGAFLMEKGDRRLVFADCAINIDPDSETLSEIAYQSVLTAKLAEISPRIAFLSFSTKGSAKGEMIDKVQAATKLFQQAHPELPADGELQFDAAFVPEVGGKKAPGSAVAGHANVLIFPELQSGNIGYKLAQRLGGYTAIGPILQGLDAPVNDLSRGCSTQDVYEMAILTAAQALDRQA